ncbi:MAG: hypothetical protein CMJ54_06625 [Planctomycetaceae bacterium]|nr:hypothetical protein [Planctomycetaceae bacterium]
MTSIDGARDRWEDDPDREFEAMTPRTKYAGEIRSGGFGRCRHLDPLNSPNEAAPTSHQSGSEPES